MNRRCDLYSKYSSLAQSVEHLTVNQGVVGSSPTGGAMKKAIAKKQLLFSVIFALRRVILLRSDIQLFAE